MEKLQHVVYINLESRPDRKKHIEEQLALVGLSGQRFNAIRLPNGALGCSMSHLKCLEMAKKEGWDHILILEDDVLFTDPTTFCKHFNTFLHNHPSFDVCLIAGNNVPPYQRIGDYCIRISHCQTTTGYLVQKHYYDTLIANYREGIALLMRNPADHFHFAIDKYWFKLQEVDAWYLIVPLTVVQREDYSDIEKKTTNYSRLMTDMDKPWLFRQTPLQSIQPTISPGASLAPQHPMAIGKKPSRKVDMTATIGRK